MPPPGESGEEAWNNMLNMDTSKIQDAEQREFVETAYMRSFKHYTKQQEEKGIWNEVLKKILVEEIELEARKFKAKKAPGPSGVTIEMIRVMDSANLEKIADAMNKVMRGEQVPKSWNRSLLRPLPKTEAGLYDMNKVRPIALMEIMLKLLERVLFTRIEKVVMDNSMLREEQYGGLRGRQMQDPIRILAELIEDANVSGKELHIFSADLSKAFDTLEYWSQAMSWRALGAPKQLVNLLVDMDRGGETEVILTPGKTSATTLGKDGRFKSQRGVRQGSVGGPMKWVVFMNFWLEYIHETREGDGYKMDEETPEILGQMMIDDSNWFTSTALQMTRMVRDCDRFVNFHGLKFNKNKCEYMAIHQSEKVNEEGGWEPWELPLWPDGDDIIPKARKVGLLKQWKEEHKAMDHEAKCSIGRCLEMGEDQPVTQQPGEGEIVKIKVAILKWEREILNTVRSESKVKEARDIATNMINSQKAKAYGQASEHEIEESTEEWKREWQQWTYLIAAHNTHIQQATRYLGVHFNMDMSWKRQTEILQDKFEELYSRISNTKPTTEMAIYCINAVINAALKFPLQVAAIPRTVIKGWDSKHRGLVKKAGYLPRNTSPELLHMPKKLGGKGLQSLEHEIDIVRVQTQMRLINTDSKAGAVVRAAKRRADGNPEKKTIQYHTQEALKRWDMSITGLEEFDCIREAGLVSQRKIDLCTATKCTKATGIAHAFGDGATWQKEGITGWGMHITREGGEVVEDWGRTPGNQNNDASETYAILQSLLHTHPDSDLHMYCDNQGCVHKWRGYREGRKRKRDRNAAMWSRIDSLRDQRDRRGAETVMHWIQSHVQDETKRTRVTSMIQCACREASGREECTKEGEDHHWLHEGNDRADELANKTREMGMPDDAIEAVRGEEEFILADDDGTAQGEYRPWISEKVTSMYVQQARSVGLGRIREAKEWSQGELWSAMIKT